MQEPSHLFFDELAIIFSRERLGGYLNNAQSICDKEKALALYSWNIELSQSLYPALQVLEIALRNSLHQAIGMCYDTDYWFELDFLHEREHKQILKTKGDLAKEKMQIEPCRIVSGLSFGFWTSLFDVRYEHHQVLWPKLLKPVFPCLVKSQRTRAFLSRELNRIRFLRNRIFHYEPIWHWKNLTEQHQSILLLIAGVSPSAVNYLASLDTFEKSYSAGKQKHPAASAPEKHAFRNLIDKLPEAVD